MATPAPLPANRRIWLTIAPCEKPGKISMQLSFMPPKDHMACSAMLITRGELPAGWPITFDVVSDATKDQALRGPAGASAYEVAQAAGFNGTQSQWLTSLVGASAYDIAREQGYGGTKAAWLSSLVGAQGASAYDLARQQGYGGTLTAWLASLVGRAATIKIGTVTTGDTGTAAAVKNSGTAADAVFDITLPRGPAGFGTITVASSARVFGTAFQPSKDKATLVTYSVKTQVTNPLLVGTSIATAKLLSDASNPPTTERARVEASSGVGVTVTLNMTTSNTAPLSYLVPAGHWVLLTQAVQGTGAVSIVAQTEEALG
jgi:hypothetical protein